MSDIKADVIAKRKEAVSITFFTKNIHLQLNSPIPFPSFAPSDSHDLPPPSHLPPSLHSKATRQFSRQPN